MQIRQIEVYKLPIKLNKPFVISLGTYHYAENIVIVIKTDEGLVGFGECSPFKSINGESVETGFEVARYLSKMLLGKNPLHIAACSVEMDRVIFGNSSIKSAFDIALHDIASQYAGLPLYEFLGGSNNKLLFTDFTVCLGNPEQMAIDAQEIKDRGFQFIKVKLGEDPEKDIFRIRAIRKQIGENIPLRLDANQGWDIQSAIYILNALALHNIQFCEEPIPRWNFMELSSVRKQSPIMVMADESCFDDHDAKRLIDLEACRSFNIKLGKSSGLLKAQKIVRLAELADIQIQIGGFLESRLGFTASAHIALTSDNIKFCDFDTPLMFSEDPVVGGIHYGANGIVSIPEGTGLGASISQEYLQQLNSFMIN